MTAPTLLVAIDNRLRLPANPPPPLITRLKQATTHANPDHGKARSMGRWTGEIPSTIKTWRLDDAGFSLPRGVTTLVRSHATSMGINIRWADRRVSSPVNWAPFLVELRRYQQGGVDRCVEVEQGLVRAPTGSGKTTMALAVLPLLKQRA